MNSILQGTSDSALKTFWIKSTNIFECIFLKKKSKKHILHILLKKNQTKTLVHIFTLTFVQILESFL